MSQVEVLSPRSPVNFDFDIDIIMSCSPCTPSNLSASISREKRLTNAIVNELLCASSHVVHATEEEDDEAIVVPGLPPVLCGHRDVHLRRGVMQAAQLSADGEPDAEKAFFVADLSYVYQQHLRWKKNLPEIEPFYGTYWIYS